MKLWVSKNSEVPVRDQLVAQITLGIASGDLGLGERLPSTRELARRFKIHQNTVSSAYRELAEKRLVNFKKGSGVFISNENDLPSSDLESLFDDFLKGAVLAGFSKRDVQDHLRSVLDAGPMDKFLVVESDAALREILIEEIRNVTGRNTTGIALEQFADRRVADGTQIVAMYDEEAKLRPILPAGVSGIFLNANSVPGSLSSEKRPSENDLIAIVSGWEKFVSFAKLFLLAAKIDPEMFIARLTSDRDWKKGIDQAAIIICDPLTAKEFPGDARVRVFPLIAESSLERLRHSINA
jgi:DNA-binding transcriptional regulator YhcF (GntR family)